MVGALALLVVGWAALLLPTRTAALAFIEQKLGINPEAGLTDAQRAALHDQAHRRNAQFLEDFVARHGDPRSLPVVKVPAEGVAPATLAQAAGQADVIVWGRVSAVSFAASPTGGLPLATVSVTSSEVVKGTPAATFVIRQVGGPVAHGQAGALAELDDDQLLLPGDSVILFLRHAPDGWLHTLPGATLFIVEGAAQAESGSLLTQEVDGRQVDRLLTELKQSMP